MSVAAATERSNSWTPPDVPTLPVRRFTVDEYHRMIDMGFFAENEAFELIHGWVVPKMTKHPPHTIAFGLLVDEFGRLALSGFHCRFESPITLGESEPEPDGSIIRGARRDYHSRHPLPAEVPLVVEVAESSLDIDQGEKLIMYAQAGIAVYWIVNLIDMRIEVYDRPTGPAASPDYLGKANYGPNDSVPVVIDGREIARIAVRDLLP